MILTNQQSLILIILKKNCLLIRIYEKIRAFSTMKTLNQLLALRVVKIL